MKKLVCVVCGRNFQARNRTTTTCDRACRKKRHRDLELLRLTQPGARERERQRRLAYDREYRLNARTRIEEWRRQYLSQPGIREHRRDLERKRRLTPDGRAAANESARKYRNKTDVRERNREYRRKYRLKLGVHEYFRRKQSEYMRRTRAQRDVGNFQYLMHHAMQSLSEAIAMNTEMEKYDKLTNEQILAEIVKIWTMVEENIVRLGALMVILQRRGAMLTLRGRMPLGAGRMIDQLLSVGNGTLLPGIVEVFGNSGKSSLVTLIGKLPIEKQQELLDDPVIPFVSINPDTGKVKQEEKSLLEMKLHEAMRVINGPMATIRTVPEQKALLIRDGKAAEPTRVDDDDKIPIAKHVELVNTPKRRGINHMGEFIPAREMAKYLAELEKNR